jgi:predicted MFS family arabinose efflux permease
MAAIEADQEARGTGFSEAYKRGVVAFLLAAYTFNFIDRTIVSTIGQAIKVDLKLTDTQLGLLGGPAFALLYTLMGVPIARLAERRNRVTIISAALVVWSGFTVACGLAANFAMLLAMRVGVGIGEAGCSPPSHSLISDYFEPKRRASALGVYAFGIPLGSMIGAISGGWLAEHAGWREAFMIVGAPGVLLAIAVKLFVREPPRGHADGPAVTASLPAGEFSELWSVTKVLFGSWPMVNMMLGVTLVSLAGYGIGAFAAPYFVRAFGLSYTVVGLIQGLLWGLAGGAGTLAGGFVSDFASRRGAKWYALTPAIGVAIATPFFAAGYMALDWHVAVLLLGIPLLFVYVYLAPTFSVVQNAVESRRRATAAAIMLLFLNIIALAGGPLLVGWMIDRFAAFDFTHPAARSLFSAIGGMLGGEGSFPCPGGLAPKGAGAALALACHSTEALATRQGILVTVTFYGWGALHYFLASFGLERRLSRAGQGV